MSAKTLVFEQFARVAKAMASANRLSLLEALAQGERSVEVLSKATGMSVANTSHHLQVLKDAGLAVSRKEGLQVFYRLSGDQIVDLLGSVRRVAESHLAEVDRIVREHFDKFDSLTPVGHEELIKLTKAGDAVVIDVRPPEEYRAGHIPGALNVPLSELPTRLKKLPHDQEVVAYCRGPYCVLAFQAVEQLRQAGFKARRLEDGFPEWKAGKRPIESGE
ncbi:MAG: metalloregulator ArsR/SmtB family transcription factor [Betaproteobacteria bacterium]|nr:metalloregulator ArsR/SmtB family transcription factor [Betaproteobacteria bacterium]